MDRLSDPSIEETGIQLVTTVYEIAIGLERTKRKISEDRYKYLYKKWLEFINGMEIFSLGFKEAEKASKIFDQLESNFKRIKDIEVIKY